MNKYDGKIFYGTTKIALANLNENHYHLEDRNTNKGHIKCNELAFSFPVYY